MLVFYQLQDEQVFKQVAEREERVYLVSYENPAGIIFLPRERMGGWRVIPAPANHFSKITATPKRAETQKKRVQIIEPLILSGDALVDSKIRRVIAKSISKEQGVSVRTLLNWYYRFLAYGEKGLLSVERRLKEKELTGDQINMRWAINKYIFSSRRMSVKGAYDEIVLPSGRPRAVGP